MWTKIRTLVVCLLVFALVQAPAFAILGLGDIVFDPTNYANAIQQLVQATQQVEQLIRNYEMLRNQYDHMQRMARTVPVNMTTRYRSPPTPLRTSVATNAYGNLGNWLNGINMGTTAAQGYQAATQALGAYGGALGQLPLGEAARLRNTYATVELTDSSNLYSLQTIGDLRGRAELLETAVRNLENDSLSADPAMNTEMAVLNKINAAGMLAVRSSQDSNRLLIGLAEAQLVQAKRTRDAEAVAIQQHAQFLSEGRAALASQTANASEAMRAFRLP